jgi:hypothetical protein
MSARRKYTLAGVSLTLIILGTGYFVTKRARQAQTHEEIAEPATLKAEADRLPGTVVTPHLECEIAPGKNVLWCASFQIAWNELCTLRGGPIQWPGAPAIATILNKRTVTSRDLPEGSYLAMAGWTTGDSNDIRQRIARELNRRFAGVASPEFLSRLDGVPPQQQVSYAYLFRELPFERAFARMRRGLRFDAREVDNFGILQLIPNDRNKARMAEQVLVYDYKSEDDFIVELKTQSKTDRLILAKIPAGATLAETVTGVQTRLRQNKPGSMQGYANFFVPVLDFEILRDYKELTTGDSLLELALQQTRFKLTERGAILKSESATVVKRSPHMNLVFDKPFLVMIQRTDASQPYFALWVANAELLVPFHETVSKTSSSVK